jgi:hypothetical protein
VDEFMDAVGVYRMAIREVYSEFSDGFSVHSKALRK